MPEILNGKEVAKKIISEIKYEVSGKAPKVATIIISQDSASKSYLNIREKYCKQVGIETEIYEFESDVNDVSVLKLIQELNNNPEISSIFLQLPFPKNIDEEKIINALDWKKDVEGITPYNLGLLLSGNEFLVPCTAKSVITILDYYNIPICGKNIVVIGRSRIVGRPLLALLLNRDATVTVCHTKTKNIQQISKTADILVSCVGKPKFINNEFVNENTVVIDVGTNYINGNLCGDVDIESVDKIVKAITPVPGGIGPITTAIAIQNIVKSYTYKW